MATFGYFVSWAVSEYIFEAMFFTHNHFPQTFQDYYETVLMANDTPSQM